MSKHNDFSIKDKIIAIVFVLLVVVQLYYQIVFQKITDIGNLINSVLLLFLSFVGFTEIASYYRWNFLVPDFYIKAMEEREEKRLRLIVDDFFDSEIKYVKNYDKARMQFLLSQLRITVEQLDYLRLELINMRCCPLKTTSDARSLLEEYIKDSQEPNIVIQNKNNAGELTYTDVDYYINFYDIMFQKDYQRLFSAALVTAIKESYINLEDIDRIVVPYDSNLLLGIGVSKILGSPVVKMRQNRGRILLSQPWDGDLPPDSKVIVVHDVLVKSDQIVLALNMLPKTCKLLGVFCLVARTEWSGQDKLMKELKKHTNTTQANIWPIITLNENDIHRLRDE